MLPLKIAFRFLWSSKGQTILIALGIAVGVSVQVFIGSLIQGLQISLVDSTIGSRSQITIVADEDTEYISNYESIKDDIESLDTDINTISFSLDRPGNMFIDEQTSFPVLMRGFDFNLASDIYEWEERIDMGRLPENDNEVIIGSVLQEESNINLNDEVTLNIPAVGEQTVTVVGIYAFNVTAIDESWVAMTIPTLQNAIGVEDVISSIEMQVDDVFLTDVTSQQISDALDMSDLDISQWKAENADLLSGLQGQSTSSIMIQVFVTLSVVLGISSVLAITVLQKSRQLGILKAMGIKDGAASLIFLFQGMLLGIIGAIGGIGLGLGLSVAFTKFAVNPDGTPVVNLYINPSFIALSAGIAFVAATMASVFPALKSRRISIIEVIKNG
jgi:lipoprotein-releasing system permease protein